jgi:predicted DNA-binding transcriptional regulator AlpA
VSNYSTASLLSDYLDKHSFCAELGISERTADRWHVLRTGPPRTKAGKKVLYRKSAISEWLKGHEHGSERGDNHGAAA